MWLDLLNDQRRRWKHPAVGPVKFSFDFNPCGDGLRQSQVNDEDLAAERSLSVWVRGHPCRFESSAGVPVIWLTSYDRQSRRTNVR